MPSVLTAKNENDQDTWQATYVTIRQIKADFESGILKTGTHEFRLTKDELRLVNKETGAVLYSGFAWEAVYESFVKIIDLPLQWVGGDDRLPGVKQRTRLHMKPIISFDATGEGNIQVVGGYQETLGILKTDIEATITDDEDELTCPVCQRQENAERIPRQAETQALAEEFYQKGWREVVIKDLMLQTKACPACVRGETPESKSE